jgi:hypothetical protein
MGIGKPENRLSRKDRQNLAQRLYEQGKGLAAMTAEEKQAAAVAGGKTGGATNAKNGTGVCGIPAVEHSKRVTNTNKQKWECPACDYINIARHVNSHMAEIHGLPKSAKLKMVG